MSKVLMVDDEIYYTSEYVDALKAHGFDVSLARSVAEAKGILSAEASRIDIVVTDIMMPSGEDGDAISTHGGFNSGPRLAQWIKQAHPDILVFGLSAMSRPDVVEWFVRHAAGFMTKSDVLPHEFADMVTDILGRQRRTPRIFIVHGHDDATKYSLKNYLQNTLGLPEPVILHEQPNGGRTILEKFEFHATRTDLVFVLVTPDDLASQGKLASAFSPRARQNVVFELGYFLGRLGRKPGRVIVLHKGPVELPSDILGLMYIDISRGIESSGEAIRRELNAIWPDSR